MEYEWKKQQPYAYWLDCVPGLGRKSRCMLTEYAGSPRAVYEMGREEWSGLLPEKKVQCLEQAKREWKPEGLYQTFSQGEIRFVPQKHPEYPERLAQIPDPPYGIYVWGKLPKRHRPAVAVIGARQCSEYGRYMARQCAARLAAAGVDVISGMARGIDGIAHEAALKEQGDTYAVLGCGVDVCYPAEHRQLYERLKKEGGVLSEYLPGTQPMAGLFPQRNRIISGLADAVLIVEAREKSGTLITADMALEQGKEVYVIPGRVTDPLSSGCNRLIAQGAGIFTTVEEMLSETGLLKLEEKKQTKQAKEERKLLGYLDYYPKSVDCLLKESGMEYRQLILELTKLCMENQAEQLSANQYIKK